MSYEIEVMQQPNYIYVTYTKQADLDARGNLTNDLIKVCKESQVFNVIIDTTEMNHSMAPIDFFAFADAFCSTVSERKIKVVIVTRKAKTFTVLTKIVMNSTGITSELFDNKEQAIEWLTKDSGE
ncbi:hypothetical protein [Kaarinaea lacus]